MNHTRHFKEGVFKEGTFPVGSALLHDPLLNKGTAFTLAERSAYRLNGLLPPHVHTISEQMARALENFRGKQTDLERYVHLCALQDRNETLFYRLLVENIDEMMPIVYTPTVGLACQQWSHLFRQRRGLYVSIKDRGHIADVLQNWERPDVRVIVVTDGERILGLGDQGIGGMGIPVGKLSIYTACAGIHPAKVLPVMLDVGTENEECLNDPLYLGLRQRRARDGAYDDFVGEFLSAVSQVMPRALIQFEDFGNTNAFRLLAQWRDRVRTFNDDIQGTAAVTLAGLYSALRITRKSLAQQTILFLGAGEAGVGIADLIVSAMVEEGTPLEDARRRCWFVDTRGLVVKGRDHLAEHKLPYAHEFPYAGDFIGALRAVKPTVIVGVSTTPKSFDREVIETMARLNERPIIFALSNPTSKSECTAEEAYGWSRGRAIFASGSPFPPCSVGAKVMIAGQANNAYVFAGVGLGVIASEASRVTDAMFARAARALASTVLESDLEVGCIYPAMKRIREVSAVIGAAVAEVAFDDGLAAIPRPSDVLQLVQSNMWQPGYESYL
jgi:malate dehydrogenase (oxaloacetate-decarboxylating)(NADP+)